MVDEFERDPHELEQQRRTTLQQRHVRALVV